MPETSSVVKGFSTNFYDFIKIRFFNQWAHPIPNFPTSRTSAQKAPLFSGNQGMCILGKSTNRVIESEYKTQLSDLLQNMLEGKCTR